MVRTLDDVRGFSARLIGYLAAAGRVHFSTPESYRKVAVLFQAFPEEAAIAAMREAGVTHITVHPHRFGNRAARTIEALSRRSDMELLAIAARPDIRLYRLR